MNVQLTNGVFIKLESLGTFDRISLAQEIYIAVDVLLKERPNDRELRNRIHDTVKKAIATLETVELGKECIEILSPLLEATKTE